MSVAGAARQASDVRVGAEKYIEGVSGRGTFGVMFNPKDYPWEKDACNVHWRELSRLEALRDKWYGKATVGDGADVVAPNDLDPWQRSAHDVVMDPLHSSSHPLRLMLMGSAGTGKS